MVEPGAPLVLGLRRTLAFQVIDVATGPNPFPRAAVWSLMAGLLGLCGWFVFRSLGRAEILEELSGAASAADREAPLVRAAPVLSAVSAVCLALWAIIVWLPIAGLVRLINGSGGSPHRGMARIVERRSRRGRAASRSGFVADSA